MTAPMQWDDHQEISLKAGVITATTHKHQCKGWFQMSHSTLTPLYANCNTLKHAIKHNSHLSPAIQATMQSDLKHLVRHISHAVLHAKAKWYADVCKKIHDMKFDPRWHGSTSPPYQGRISTPQEDNKHGNATPQQNHGNQCCKKHGGVWSKLPQCLQFPPPH